MIETAEVSEENHNNLKMIQKGANLLGSMIGNILDYAQTEQGILSFKESGVDLTALTSSVLNVDNETAKQKGLEFHYESQLQEDEVLLVDSSRYEQLLHHLLVNAIKFTDTGSIHVELKELRRDEGEVVLMLKVKDTGIGIPENELKSIFEPFYQVDMQKNRVSEGAGIGLSLCKSVAEHYDGTIHVESKEGIGTTFHAKLVLKRSSERQHFKGGHGDENPKRRKVMAVEDNASNIVLIKKVLKKLGQDVIVAKNGEEAIAKYNEEKPDFVFMDLSMPLMDGFEATKIIRLMDRHTPIYALSANVMDRDVERCRDMGMNGHIAKPIRIAKLRKALFDHDDLAEPPLINVL
jgi:CheY-like chemotaxis protein